MTFFILVDTCIWSLALRRKKIVNHTIVNQLYELILESRVSIIGPIRQEILSGITDLDHFHQLRKHLSAFKDLSLLSADFETAAEFYNTARKKGIQGSNTDFLICATAVNYKMPIFTIDKDFFSFAKFFPLRLYTPS